MPEPKQGPASAAPAAATLEPLAAILAEMRAAAKSTDLFNGEEVGEPLIRGTKIADYADRIEAAHSMPGKECVEGCETLRLVKKALGEEEDDRA